MTDRPEWPEPRVPKYYGLKRHLHELTLALQPGSPLPPERILAAEFGLSRTSVRQALYELVVEGRLERVQGRGTFVAQPKRARPLRLAAGPGLAAWPPEAWPPENGGRDPARAAGPDQPAHSEPAPQLNGRLLAAEQVSADDEVAARLGLRRAGRALRVERLRTADGEPMSVELSWLPARRFPGLLRRLGRTPAAPGADPAEAVDDAVAGAYQGGPPAGEQTIETVLAGPREAALLGVDVGSPLLLVCRHGRDTGGLPVEWTLAWYRGDRYKFVLSLPAGPG